jgi:uncharacterized protein (DUF1778 family)
MTSSPSPDRSSDNRLPGSAPVNIRVRHRQRLLIDRAAQMAGKTRSEFMVDAACREAEDVLLDRRFFLLDPKEYARFLKMLDAPAKPNYRLRALLDTKPVWEK